MLSAFYFSKNITIRTASAGIIIYGYTFLKTYFRLLSLNRHQPASSDADTFCQTLNIAPGNAARLEKYFIASATLKPEFCIPTSIPIVRQIFLSHFNFNFIPELRAVYYGIRAAVFIIGIRSIDK